MAWEVFERLSAGSYGSREVKLRRDSRFGISPELYSEVNNPPAFLLLWDTQKRRVGLKPTQKDDRNGYVVKHAKEASPAEVTATKFCKMHGLKTDTIQSFQASIENGVIVINF